MSDPLDRFMVTAIGVIGVLIGIGIIGGEKAVGVGLLAAGAGCILLGVGKSLGIWSNRK